jgi:ATPase subunit of ABC transporter with duplicated ATPase domains
LLTHVSVQMNVQDTPDRGDLRVGETVVPLYVDQSRDALDPTKSVFEEITDGFDEISIGMHRTCHFCALLSWLR